MYSRLSARDAFGYPKRFRSASEAGLSVLSQAENIAFAATGNANVDAQWQYALAPTNNTQAYLPYRTSTQVSSYVRIGPADEEKNAYSYFSLIDTSYMLQIVSLEVHNHKYLVSDNSDCTVVAVQVEGSNDGADWTVLGSQSAPDGEGDWLIPCAGAGYSFFRIRFTHHLDNGSAALYNVSALGVLKQKNVEFASPYNPAALTSADWEISYSYSWWDANRPYKAFNFGENAAVWGSNTTSNGVGQWLCWKSLGEKKCIKRYQLRTGTDNTGTGFSLQGSDDGETWTTIDSRIADSNEGVRVYSCESNNIAYIYHRILCTSMASGAHFQLCNIAAFTS